MNIAISCAPWGIDSIGVSNLPYFVTAFRVRDNLAHHELRQPAVGVEQLEVGVDGVGEPLLDAFGGVEETCGHQLRHECDLASANISAFLQFFESRKIWCRCVASGRNTQFADDGLV